MALPSVAIIMGWLEDWVLIVIAEKVVLLASDKVVLFCGVCSAVFCCSVERTSTWRTVRMSEPTS